MLRLNSVSVTNFCQHSHLEFEIPYGLTVIIGRNGAGKSNLLRAINGGLTGTFSRFSGDTNADVIQQGKDKAVVEVKGEFGNKPFRIQRQISKNSVSHTLDVEGGAFSTIRNKAEVQNWIAENTGLTSQLIDTFVFIRQNEIHSFLSSTNSERAVLFQRLCGTKMYADLDDGFAEELKKDKLQFTAVNEAVTEQLKQQVIQSEAREKALTDEIANFKRTYPNLEADIGACKKRIQRIKDDLDVYAEYFSVENARNEAVSHLNTCEAEYARIEKTVYEVESRIQELRTELCLLASGEDINTHLRHLQNKQAVYERRQHLQQQLRELESEYVTVPSKPSPTDVQERIKRNTEKTAELQTRLGHYEKLLSIVNQLGGHSDGCPLCGANKQHWNIDLLSLQDEHTRIRNEINANKIEIKSLQTEQSAYETSLRNYEKAQILRQKQDTQAATLKETLESTPIEEPQTEAIEKITALQNNISKHTLLLSNEKETLRRNTEVLKKVQQSVIQYTQQLQDISKSPLTTEDHASCKEELKQQEHMLTEYTETLHRLTTFQTSLKEAASTTQRLQAQLQSRTTQNSKLYKNWFTISDGIRKWLSKEGLPKIIHSRVLRNLTRYVNEELSHFGNPFTLADTDNLTFEAIFDTGKKVRTNELSGGERTITGLAFWRAVSKCFIQDLGLLVLDEPTTALDKRNNEHLYELLCLWKRHLHKEQVVIVTHDENLVSAADTVISL